MKASLRTVVTLSLLVASPSAALANGAAFFNTADPDNGASIGGIPDGILYYGFVRDDKGRGIEGAKVTITVPTMGNIEYVYTNEAAGIGLYRGAWVTKDMDPKLVQVDAYDPGYTVVSKVNKTPGAKPGAPVEVDFVLKPNQQSAK